MCEFMAVIKEKEYNRINSGRTQDQKLSLMGFLNDGYVKARETRDATVASCSPSFYLEVREETPLEGWNESIQENDRSTNTEGLLEWDYVVTWMEVCWICWMKNLRIQKTQIKRKAEKYKEDPMVSDSTDNLMDDVLYDRNALHECNMRQGVIYPKKRRGKK